jgi:hypothetical protein
MTTEEFNKLCEANSFGAVARGGFPLVPSPMLKSLVEAAVLAESLKLNDRINRLEKWIACLNPIAQHSGQSENREWHGVDIGWLHPSQVVYLGEARP